MKLGLERERELAGMNLVAEAVLAYHDKSWLGKPLRAQALLAVFDVILQEFQENVERVVRAETVIIPVPEGVGLISRGDTDGLVCPSCFADLQAETKIRRKA